MLVSRRIATDSWRRLDMESKDVVGISLETADKTVHIFNIYNDREHLRSICTLNFYLRSAEGRRSRERGMVDI